MISTSNIERLIAEKRREIEREKMQLGLSPQLEEHAPNNKENGGHQGNYKQQVKFSEGRVLWERNDSTKDKKEKKHAESEEVEDFIPARLERYIRKYIGLPVMLKAGEYSPNNPLVRGERAAGDALLGLGEYERRRNTLRKIRQQQYREYLDQQAKKKQEAKEQAERERREREQREKEKEERERQLIEERDRFSPDRRRSVTHVQSTAHVTRDQHSQCFLPVEKVSLQTKKVDTGVQVDGFSQPLSVAVQTDDTELFRASPSPGKCQLTEAERELSPRTVHAHYNDSAVRRRSHGDYDERSYLLKKCNRDKLTSDLRHTYMPSIFDADAIQLRNMQAEKEAAERRQYYQQELRNQIEEQQRIREERKTREKMLEQAEMRRLEEQLRMLRMAQDKELGKQQHITACMKENASEYDTKRIELQREIDAERDNLLRVTSQNFKPRPRRNTDTSKSDTHLSKLPPRYPNERTDRKPYSLNIPDNSIFSKNYDVDSYLRRNLNFNKNKDIKAYDIESIETPKSYENKNLLSDKLIHDQTNKVETHTALIHEPPSDRPKELKERPSGIEHVDSLPIPVLRHSPQALSSTAENIGMSDAMKKVEDKWKVPAVQKNILKALPNEEGKNVSILTQLGSIRRQLQLEQLKLDNMLSKDDVI